MRMLRYCSAAFLGMLLVLNPTVARSITADRTCKIEASGEGGALADSYGSLRFSMLRISGS